MATKIPVIHSDADTSLDTKSYFHATNSWIKVELRVTRMEKKRCHNGRHLFLAFHPKTTRHVSPSSSLIATSLATKVALNIHTHVHTQAAACYFDSLVPTWPSCHWNRSPWSFHALFCLRFVSTSELSVTPTDLRTKLKQTSETC